MFVRFSYNGVGYDVGETEVRHQGKGKGQADPLLNPAGSPYSGENFPWHDE